MNRIHLPHSLLKIAEYCGDDVMWALLEHYGGGHVAIPKQLSPDHSLCKTLGPEMAQQLSATFGGEILRIPGALKARLEARNAAIRQDYVDGLTQHELARKYRITERQIGCVCRSVVRLCNSTADLFFNLS